jgi:hypothetical protein
MRKQNKTSVLVLWILDVDEAVSSRIPSAIPEHFLLFSDWDRVSIHLSQKPAPLSCHHLYLERSAPFPTSDLAISGSMISATMKRTTPKTTSAQKMP